MKKFTVIVCLYGAMSACSDVSRTSKSQSDRQTTCAQLNISEGFSSDAQFELALQCTRASQRYPTLMQYFEQLKTRSSTTEIRTWANEVLAQGNLESLTAMVSRWEGYAGAEDLHAFGERARPIFSHDLFRTMFGPLGVLDLQQWDNLAWTRLIYMAADNLENHAQAEALRVAFSEWLNLSATETFFEALAKLVLITDVNGEKLLPLALSKTSQLAEKQLLGEFLSAHLAFEKTGAFQAIQPDLSAVSVSAAWQTFERNGGLAALAGSISRSNRVIRCGITVYENGALEMLRRVVNRESLGFVAEVAKRWPKEHCGILKEDLNRLLVYEQLLKKDSSHPLRTWLNEFVRRNEEQALLNELDRASESGIASAWEPWLRAGFDSNLIPTFVESFQAVSSVKLRLENRPEVPFVEFLRTEMDRWFLSLPETSLFWISLAKPNIQQLLTEWSTEMTKPNGGLKDLPHHMLPLFEVQTFPVLRGLILAIRQEKGVSLSLLNFIKSTVNNPISKNFADLPPTPEAFVESLQLLNSLRAVYGFKR